MTNTPSRLPIFPRGGASGPTRPPAKRHALPGDHVAAALRLFFKVAFPLAVLADVFHVEWAAQAVTALLAGLLLCVLLLPIALIALAVLATTITQLLR